MVRGSLTRKGRIRTWRSASAAGLADPAAGIAAEALFARADPPGRPALAGRLRRERLHAASGSGYSIARHLALIRALAGETKRAPRGSLRGRPEKGSAG